MYANLLLNVLYHIEIEMKIRESCLQTGNFIYKPGISLTKQDFHLQRGILGLQRGFSGYYLPDYIPYLATVIIYIGIANLIGLLGFKPPTKDMNVTAALAVMSIVLIEVAGIRAKGTKRWLKSFAEPMPVILPINILEIFIKPLSLCMRLFGNVLGSFVIMELLKMVVPAIVPAVFSCYFDIFDGLIQAYVFVFLTGLFIKEATE